MLLLIKHPVHPDLFHAPLIAARQYTF